MRCKVFSLFALFLAYSFLVSAQQKQPKARCGTVEAMAELRAAHPELESDTEFEKNLTKAIEAEKARLAISRNFDEVLYIPVVVHIIHQGQAIGTGDNLPDAQVYSQIKVLNQDYRRLFGSRGYNTDPRGGDAAIQFVLAKRNPQGGPTNGIDRISGSSIGLTSTPYSQTQLSSTIKPKTVWDATRYFNIWVANVNGLYGVAQFPGNTSLAGMACSPNPNTASTDGVTINPISFGSADDGNFPNLDAGTNYGRTGTHETGHWLGLRHIWGDASCGNDYCEDTPIHQSANNLTCPTHPKANSCGTADEMFENYMDYSADGCVNIFTRDQIVRMRAVLRTSPRRKELLNSIALVPPVPVDVGLAQIVSPTGYLCSGQGLTAKLLVKNWGTSPLTSVTLTYALAGGQLQTLVFDTLGIAAGATDTLKVKGIDLNVGENKITYWTSLPNGQADTINFTDTLQTTLFVGQGQSLPNSESFESQTPLPDYWSSVNPANDCSQWRKQSVPVGSTGLRSVAAYYEFYNNTASSALRDELRTHPYDLTAATACSLYFDLSHARLSTKYGTLKIEISTDCGATWQTAPVYSKTGAALATITTSPTGEFFPSAASQWRRELVSLDAFVGKTILLRFVALNTGGNNLYIDNIQISTGPLSAPIVTTLVPDSGVFGTTVVIHGKNLSTTQYIKFANTVTFNFTILNDSTITATVPTGASTGKVTVITGQGNGISPGDFLIVAPTQFLSFSPGIGQVSSAVTLTGINLQRAQRVYFNPNIASSFTVNSASSISTTVPVGATSGKISILTSKDSLLSSQDFLVGSKLTLRTGSDISCSGILVTPNYPNNYSNSLSYTYKISAPAGQQIIFTFLSFATESGFDFVSIYDGPSTTSTALLKSKSGTFTQLPTYTSTKGTLTITFTSDITGNNIGFAAQINCTPPPAPLAQTLSPRQGPVGYPFAIAGKYLDKIDTVLFGGQLATGLTKTTSALQGVVPVGAKTGKIKFHSSSGWDSTAQDYVVTEGLAYCQPGYAACGTAGLARVQITDAGLYSTTPCTDASGAAFTIYPMGDSTTGWLRSGGFSTLRVNIRGTGLVAQAWADWNRNGLFESTESISFSQQPTSAQQGLAYIVVPANTDTGNVGLRIRTASSLLKTDACTNKSSGSGAEYTLKVLPCSPVTAPTDLAGATVCLGDTVKLQVSGVGTRVWFSSLTSTDVLYQGNTLATVPTTTTTYVVALLSEGCLSEKKEVVATVNPAPKADFTVNGNDLMVAQSSQGPRITYQWLLNSQTIAGATDLQYTIGVSGMYALQVTDSNGCHSVSAAQNLTYTNVAPNVQRIAFSASPNPSEGVFLVKTTAPAQAAVFDMLGRVVWSGAIQKSALVDLSKASKGVYFLQAAGASALRLVVE